MKKFPFSRPVQMSSLLLLALVFVPACGDGRVACYPVHGKVTVNGKPAHNRQVIFTPDGADTTGRLPASAMTNEQGEFQLDTQERVGAPAGDYLVTFAWREASGLLKNAFDGPDRLKGKYADPSKKLFPIKLEQKPNDLPPFDLKTN
jgi:hypothetical protein